MVSIWTRVSGSPLKMGSLEQTNTHSILTYDSDFIDKQLPGVSRLLSPQKLTDDAYAFEKRDRFQFIPPIQALIPPNIEHNFQRQLTLKYLVQKGVDVPNDQREQDLLILKTTGHGGIGHIDVFSHDDAALSWYQQRSEQKLHIIDSDFGFSLKEFMSWYEINDQTEQLLSLLGPTPTAGGAIPKLLMSVASSSFDNRLGLPSQVKQNNIKDVLLKLEKNTAYPGMMELEAFALDMAQLAGFNVPNYFLSQINEIPVIGIDRFDRDSNKNPLPVESIYSLMALADKSVTHNHSSHFERIIDLINSPKADVFTDKRAAKRHLIKTLMFSLLIGNGDLHMENLSVITANHKTQFSPVYDPTPMRAYPLHDILMPMPFGAYGEHDGQYKIADALVRFSKSCGISKKELTNIFEELMLVIDVFEFKLESLKSLPNENKSKLLVIHKSVCQELLSNFS